MITTKNGVNIYYGNKHTEELLSLHFEKQRIPTGKVLSIIYDRYHDNFCSTADSLFPGLILASVISNETNSLVIFLSSWNAPFLQENRPQKFSELMRKENVIFHRMPGESGEIIAKYKELLEKNGLV